MGSMGTKITFERSELLQNELRALLKIDFASSAHQ
jgi:hypothetical protein